MRIAADTWLGEMLQREAFRVDGVEPSASGEAEQLREHLEAHPRAFRFAKVETRAIEQVRLLSRAGFTVVDVNMTFAATPAAVASAPRDGVEVAEVTADERDDVLDIAGSCFRYSRFHLDPQIATEVAHRIKREWIRNYLNGGRGDRIFAARVAGRTAGFLAALTIEHDGRRTAVIDLVGVAADLQRRGVGRALVGRFADHYAGACGEVRVGTQAANVPSMRLYEEMGFRAVQSAYVMHQHPCREAR